MSAATDPTKHEALCAKTQRVAGFAQLELGTLEKGQIYCDDGVHFIVLVVDMSQESGGGWDCRSTLCREHAVKLLRTMATVIEKQAQRTEK